MYIIFVSNCSIIFRVTFFMQGIDQQAYDGRIVHFNSYPTLPAPPPALLFEHFKQAVLANMKGAGKIPFLDYDPNEDPQSLAAFEGSEGKTLLEAVMMNKAPTCEAGENDDSSEHGTLVDVS